MKVFPTHASLALVLAVCGGSSVASPPHPSAVTPAKQASAARQRSFKVKYQVPQGKHHRVTVTVLDRHGTRIAFDKQCAPGQSVDVRLKTSPGPVRIQVYDNDTLKKTALIAAN